MFSLCFCCRIASYNWECEIPSAVGVKKASTNLQPVQRHDWTDSLPTFPNNIMLRVFVEATKFATGTDVHLKLQNVSDVPEIWPWHSLLLIPAHHFTGLLWLWKAISYMNTKQIIKYIRYSMIFLVCFNYLYANLKHPHAQFISDSSIHVVYLVWFISVCWGSGGWARGKTTKFNIGKARSICSLHLGQPNLVICYICLWCLWMMFLGDVFNAFQCRVLIILPHCTCRISVLVEFDAMC